MQARRLWPDERAEASSIGRTIAEADAYQRQRLEEARLIWTESVPIGLTPGEDYLRRVRAIDAPLGPRLRWHWKLFAVVAAVTDPLTDLARGVQLTPIDK